MLTPEEFRRKNELLNRYRHALSLTRQEAEELTALIKKDESIDDSLKLLLIFALGALIGHLLSKK